MCRAVDLATWELEAIISTVEDEWVVRGGAQPLLCKSDGFLAQMCTTFLFQCIEAPLRSTQGRGMMCSDLTVSNGCECGDQHCQADNQWIYTFIPTVHKNLGRDTHDHRARSVPGFNLGCKMSRLMAFQIDVVRFSICPDTTVDNVLVSTTGKCMDDGAMSSLWKKTCHMLTGDVITMRDFRSDMATVLVGV